MNSNFVTLFTSRLVLASGLTLASAAPAFAEDPVPPDAPSPLEPAPEAFAPDPFAPAPSEPGGAGPGEPPPPEFSGEVTPLSEEEGDDSAAPP